jgi:hypothetical protein
LNCDLKSKINGNTLNHGFARMNTDGAGGLIGGNTEILLDFRFVIWERRLCHLATLPSKTNGNTLNHGFARMNAD